MSAGLGLGEEGRRACRLCEVDRYPTAALPPHAGEDSCCTWLIQSNISLPLTALCCIVTGCRKRTACCEARTNLRRR